MDKGCEDMDQFRAKRGYICDMDGVIYHGNRLLPGVKEFVNWLYQEGKQFLFLTNNSGKTPRELQDKLARMGLEVDEKHFYTSALATAEFMWSSGNPPATTTTPSAGRSIWCRRAPASSAATPT